MATYTVDGETTVNTYTTETQYFSVVTSFSDGGWVVVWSGKGAEDTDTLSIYQQRYDADGNAVGGETLVNTYTADSQSNPTVTTLKDGGWVVAWDGAGSGDSQGIWLQRYDSEGNTVGSETLVNTTSDGDQSAAVITALSDGGWVVTWTDTGTNYSHGVAYQQRYSADGSTVGTETLVTEAMWVPTTCAVTALGDGGWVTTWEGSGDADDMGIYQQRYDADGNTVGSATLVNTYTTGQQYYQTVTALSDGGWVVAWNGEGSGDSFGIFQQRYDSEGNTVGDSTMVNTYTDNTQITPQITALSNGGWVVVWISEYQDGYRGGVYAQAYDADGNADGGETQINTTTSRDQTSATVTALEDGGYVVTWTNDYDINQTVVSKMAFANVVLTEDGHHGFASTDLGFGADATTSLVSTKVTALPANGTLTLDGEAVIVGQVIAAADLAELVWTPDANDNGEDLATLKFTSTDSDGAKTKSVITFDVTAVADAPVAHNDTASLTEDGQVSVDVQANDRDVDGDMLLTTAASVTSGDATVKIVAGELVVSYTGDNLHAGEEATIKITYTLSDGSLSDTAKLTVTVNGIDGDDIVGTPGKDTLTGSKVGEFIDGLASNDTISGLGGNDTIRGRAGNDIIAGGSGADAIGGDAGNDSITGGGGNDHITGGTGKDVLNGGAGKDVIDGGAGNDRIIGAAGNDTLTGYHGSDTFVFATGGGHDTITDFVATGKADDAIDLSDFSLTFKQLTSMMDQDGKDVVIDLGHKTEITLQNVDLQDLSEADFVL